MSNEKKPADEAKAKFLEALEKKKNKNSSLPGSSASSGPKIGGSQTPGAPAPRFQRKSGPSGTAG
jgi:hypothetical protein